MAAFCIFAALAGPLWRLLSTFSARPALNEEGTNYLGAAFGAVGVTLSAFVLIPLAIAMLVVAWGILSHRTWAWWAALVLAAACVFAAFTGMLFAGLKFLVIAVGVAVAIGWVQHSVREWYGAA